MSKFWYMLGVVAAAGVVAVLMQPMVVKKRAARNFRQYYGLPK